VARLILDSEVLIATERAGKHLNGVIDDDDDVAIAAISAAELLTGVNLADAAHRDKRTAFVRSVLDTIPIEVYDLSVARAHADLLAHVRRAGRPRGAHDLIIAAHALQTERTVLTFGAKARFGDLPGVSAIDA